MGIITPLDDLHEVGQNKRTSPKRPEARGQDAPPRRNLSETFAGKRTRQDASAIDLAESSSPATSLFEALASFLTPAEATVTAFAAATPRATDFDLAVALSLTTSDVRAARATAAATLARLTLDDLQLLLDAGFAMEQPLFVDDIVPAEPLLRTKRQLDDIARISTPAATSTDRLTPEQFIEWWIPRRPLASNDFENLGLNNMTRENALTHIHIEIQPSSLRNLIVIDLDDEQPLWTLKALVEEDESLPEPSFTVVNRASGHAHVGWFIECAAGTEKPLAWLKDIREKMTIRLRGDRAYHGTTMRNPMHQNHLTFWGTNHRYSLAELNAYVDEIVPVRSVRVQEKLAETGGRNDLLHVLVREWAYRNRRHYRDDDFDRWYEAVLATTFAFNDEQFPGAGLPASELAAIARSTAKWVWERDEFSASGFARLQAARAALAPHVIASRLKYVQALLMSDAGMTATEIGEVLGYSTMRSSARAIRAAKAWRTTMPLEYLAIISQPPQTQSSRKSRNFDALIS
ncbi:replication initiation protein [Lacisediminihabitans sp. FW035]